MRAIRNFLYLVTLSCGFWATNASAGPASSESIAGDYAGYIISTLQPGNRMTGRNAISADGSFEYEGYNGVKVKGQLNFSNPRLITGSGIAMLPKAFGFLQMKYADGTINTPLTFRGRLVNGTLQGSYSSRYEQGLFHFMAANAQPAIKTKDADYLGVFLMPPDDIPYRQSTTAKPIVIVVPGDFQADAAFAQEVSASFLADTSEAELMRAGFDVLERSNFGDALAQLKAGYLRGKLEPEIARLLEIGKAKEVRWIVSLDLQSATKLTQPAPPSSAQQEPLDTKKDLDKFIAILSVIAEMTDKRTIDLWKLKLRYRVIDRSSAKVVHEGHVEDVLMTTQITTSTLGAYSVMPPDVSFNMMTRRVVQLAVAQLDEQLATR